MTKSQRTPDILVLSNMVEGFNNLNVAYALNVFFFKTLQLYYSINEIQEIKAFAYHIN